MPDALALTRASALAKGSLDHGGYGFACFNCSPFGKRVAVTTDSPPRTVEPDPSTAKDLGGNASGTLAAHVMSILAAVREQESQGWEALTVHGGAWRLHHPRP